MFCFRRGSFLYLCLQLFDRLHQQLFIVTAYHNLLQEMDRVQQGLSFHRPVMLVRGRLEQGWVCRLAHHLDQFRCVLIRAER